MTAMRNPDAKHIDFSDLQGIIPSNPRFLPSNLDMVYERNGHFLVGEWKRRGEKISGGQRLLLHRLASLPQFKILLIVGDTDNGMAVHDVYKLTAEDVIRIGEGKEFLAQLINVWYDSVRDRK
jgi:hypothetical protein